MLIKLGVGKLSFIDQVVVSGGRFLVGLILARELGAEVFGLYAILWSVVQFLALAHSSFITMPMMSIGTRVENLSSKKYVSTLFIYQLIFTGVVIAALVIIVWGISYFVVSIKWDLILSLTIYACGYFFFEFLRKHLFTIQRAQHAFVLDVAVYGVSIFILLGIIYSGELTLSGSFLWISLPVWGAVVLYYLVTDLFEKVNKKYFLIKTEELLSFGSPLMHASATQFVSGHLFVYVSAFLIGVSAAGEIGAARHAMGPLLTLLIAFENFVPIQASRENDAGHDYLRGYFKKLISSYALPITGVCISIFVFSDDIIRTMYGDKFHDSGYILKWFSAFFMFQFLTKVLSIYCRTLSNVKFIKLGGTLSLISSVLITYPLINYFEYFGAMFSLLVQQVLLLVPLLLVFLVPAIKEEGKQ